MQVCIPVSYFVSARFFFSILVNTTSNVKRYQFAKVFWEYTESAEGVQDDVSEKSAASLRKLPRMAKVASPRETEDCKNKKPERAELLYCPRFLSMPAKCQAQGEHAEVCVKNS